MSMSEKDIKLLWGRAGNRCAICRTELSHKNTSSIGKFVVGEQAHIIGENSRAARWNSILVENEREGYHNRILLCPNDHTIIDKNEHDWPVEKLHMMKTNHELWYNKHFQKLLTVDYWPNKLLWHR